MAVPSNQRQAARQAKELLARTLPGSRRGSIRSHLQRAEYIADTIWRRWQVGPHQWQVKYLRWYLTEKINIYTPGTRYRHWLTVRVLVFALGKEYDWLPHLQGPWLRPTGKSGELKFGRPAKLPR
ncbi:MAG: hypothetical protein IPK19_28295 [Chloroflexi bacterium]|nr:hypothetical protein [Chloroflexota bacterium]